MDQGQVQKGQPDANPKTKVKSRPRKILQPKPIAKKRLSIFNQNAADSRLLSLPPEIRNRIWRYVLTGHTIHVHSGTRSLVCRVCKKEEDDKEMATRLKVSNMGIGIRGYLYDHLHPDCILRWFQEDNATQSVSIGLLRTCRQIHLEAALLPFQENRFSFPSTLVLIAFVKKLIPMQSNSIKKLTIATIARTSSIHSPSKNFLEHRLINLADLVVVTNFSRPVSQYHTGMELQDYARVVRQFRHLNLTSVVAVACQGRLIRHRPSLAEQNEMRDFTDRIEKEVLEDQEEIKRRTMNETKERGEENRARTMRTRLNRGLRPLKN